MRTTEGMTPVRLAHFSDVHLTSRKLGWGPRDFASKKVTGWVNVKLLGRGRRFRYSNAIADALVNDMKTRGYDGIIFSGDATKLAFRREFEHAAAKLCVGDAAMPTAMAVPGNHDYYTFRCFTAGRFEHAFAPWQHGERVDGHKYPFAKKIGGVWLIGVNSSTPNFWTWDASGGIGEAQLKRFRELCGRLDDGPRVVVTHYPLRTPRGKVEHSTHRLRDHAEAAAAAKECGISLWLHGHIHRGYTRPAGDDLPFHTVSAGSATQTNRWGYNEYLFDGEGVKLRRRVFDPTAGEYQNSEESSLLWPDFSPTLPTK